MNEKVEKIEIKNGRYEFKDRVCWYKNGRFHREDGPAIEYSSGGKEWWFHGKQHREDGPAVIIPNGQEIYFINGEHHRLDGPAIINLEDGAVSKMFGKEIWKFNGLFHREDGPAVTYPDGKEEYWLFDKQYSKEDFLKYYESLDTKKSKLKK